MITGIHGRDIFPLPGVSVEFQFVSDVVPLVPELKEPYDKARFCRKVFGVRECVLCEESLFVAPECAQEVARFAAILLDLICIHTKCNPIKFF